MIKIIKRLLIFFVAAFIALSAIIYIVINEPFIQNRLVRYVNTHFLEQEGINLEVRRISYNVFLRTLDLSQVQINDLQSTESSSTTLNAESLSFKLEIFNSYFKKNLIIDKISISNAKLKLNYNESGELQLPKIFQTTTQPSENADPLQALDENFAIIPSQISIENFTIALGEPEAANYQNIVIKNFSSSKKQKRLNSKKWFEIEAELNPSSIKLNANENAVTIESLYLKGDFFTDGKVAVSKLETNSNVIDFSATATAMLKDPLSSSLYEIDIQKSQISNDELFKLFNLNAQGQLNFVGKVLSEEKNPDIKIVGHAAWKKFEITGLDLYEGQTDLIIQNQTLNYTNAILNAPNGGIIKASGKYEFFDQVYTENIGQVQNLSLQDLFKLFGTELEAVDANLNTDQFIISGYFKKNITPTNTSELDISIQSKVYIPTIHLAALVEENRAPLPEMYLTLTGKLTNDGINFNESYVNLNTQGSNQIIKVTDSLLKIKPNPNLKMTLIGKQLNLSFIEYFIKQKASGILDFNGVVTYNAQNPGIKFTANIDAQNGKVAEIPFSSAKGQFGLYENHAELKNLAIIPNINSDSKKITASTQTNDSFINIDYFSFQFKDLYSKLTLSAKGDLAPIIASFKSSLPPILQKLKGTIEHLSLKMSGYLTHIETWNIDVDAQLSPFYTERGLVNSLEMNLACAAEVCTRSKILLTGFHLDQNGPLLPDSSALILLYKFSPQQSNFAFQLQNMPVNFIDFAQTKIDGNIYSIGEIKGTWKKPYGDVDLTIDHFELNDHDLGQITATLQSESSENAQLMATAFNGQARLTLSIPLRSETQNSQLMLNLYNFDIGNFFGTPTAETTNIYSRFNANFEAEGPWDFSFKNGFDFFDNWKGTGNIYTSILQYYGANLQISTAEEVKFSNNTFRFDKVLLTSKFGSADINGRYNLKNYDITLNAKLNADLAPLSREFYLISDSVGSVNGEFSVTGNLHQPKFSGQIGVQAQTLAILSDTPPFTDIEGNILLHDSVIEIQKFTAKKGRGDVSLTGSFDFQNYIESQNYFPKTNLHLVTRNTPFEIPIPIFRKANLLVTTDLRLSGDQLPLSLDGRIRLQKLNIFRDLLCSEIFAEYKNLAKSDPKFAGTPLANLRVNLQAVNSITLQSQCLRGTFSTGDSMYIVGNTNLPLLDGALITNNAVFNILKARFDVQKAEFYFSEAHKYDPIVNIEMDARVASYNIFWDVNGRLTTAKLNLTAQPQYLPSGDPVNQDSILFMITTGRIPTQDSLNTILQTSSGVYSYFGANNSFSNVVDQTVSTVTGGLFDSLTVQPNAQNGQISVRVIASKYFSQRLNFGLSFEGGRSENDQPLSTSTAFVYYLLNSHVGFTGAFSTSNSSSQAGSVINELSGGLRFNFGSY